MWFAPLSRLFPFRSKQRNQRSKAAKPRPLMLEVLESRLAPAVSVLNSFGGAFSAGDRPPDTCGAAGPNSYIETVNTEVKIFDKTTGAAIADDNLQNFLWTVGGITPATANARLGDATMCYDEIIGRFVVGITDFRPSDIFQGPSQFDFAVSNTSNPTALDRANWTFCAPIPISEGTTEADYPGNIGYNHDALVITFNIPGTGHSQINALNQSDLAVGSNTPRFTQFDQDRYFWRPVTMHDSVAGDPMWFVHTDGGGDYQIGDGNTINLLRVDHILTSHNVTQKDITVNSFGTVNDSLNPDGTKITVPTPTTPANGGTIIMKAAEANNLIVASQQTGVGTTENDARWYEFNVSDINNPTLVDQGNVSAGNNTYLMYPGIDINADGDIAMSYIRSGTDTSTDYMSVWVTGRKSSDPAGTMETPVLVRAGDSNNLDTREGDLSGINVDADGTFWIANEFARLTTWGTEIAHFAIGPKAFIDDNGVLRVKYVNNGDFIILERNSADPILYEVIANNLNIGHFNIASFSSVYVQLGGGNETVDIENTVFGVHVTVDEGSGSDTVDISRLGALLDNIQGDVFIDRGTAADTLNVYDQNDSSGDTWTITGSTITRTRSAVVHYYDQGVVVVNGGSGNLTYNVLSTEAGFSTGIDTGPGADTVNVQATDILSRLTINDLFPTSNHDMVNIGSRAPFLGGTLVNIAGTINVANSFGGGTTLNVDDSGDANRQTFTVTSGSITGTAFSPLPGIRISGAINYNGNNGGHEVTAIRLLGGGGGNTFNVQSTASGTPISINTDTLTASTNNQVNIGNTAPTLGGTLENVAGPVNVGTAFGSTTLTLDDTGDATGQAFTVTNNSITGTEFTGAINYSHVSTLTFDGGFGGDTINVQSTSATTNLVLAGRATVNVGNAGSVQGIAGALNIENPTGSNSVVVDDSSDTTPRNGTLSTLGANQFDSELNLDAWGQIAGLAPAPINYEYSDTTGLTIIGGSGIAINVYGTSSFATFLQTGAGNDTVNVLATTGPLYLDGENGTDTVTIGSLAPGLGGTLANIAGPVNVDNSSGGTTLRVDDSGDTVGKTATLTDGLLTGLAPAAISWHPTASTTGGVNFLDILGGSGGNTFNVANTSNLDFGTRIQTGAGNDKVNVQATTGVFSVYNNAGSDTVTIGSLAPSLGGTLANINAYVVAGGPGPVAVIVDDSGDATSRAATLTRNAVSTNTLGGMSPAPIYYESNVTSLTIDAGSGNDSLTVAGPSTGTHVTYNAGGGSNTLIGPNLNNTWNITSLNGGTLDGNTTFSSVQNLIGGASNDTFAFINGGSLAGSIDGGGGSNTLNYSGYTGDVTVNLRVGTASQMLGGITNIANVLGSIGNDLIVGDANPNMFVGGTGRNIIIGGAGPDQITGGGGDNILIGGTTVWDANAAALEAIMQEWTDPALTFDQRVNALRRGIVVNGQTYALNTSTVMADNSPDNLIGGGGRNWFIVDFDDIINNGAGPGPNDRVMRV
jgi:hypothetical protein